jgi:hypothetical protein
VIQDSTLTGGQIAEALTSAYLRPLAIIHLAVSAGPILFAVIVLFVMSTTGEVAPEAQDNSLLNVLSLANIFIMGSAWFVGTFIFQRLCSKQTSDESTETDPTLRVERVLASLRNGLMVRLVMIEGAAIFGLTVCLISIMRGVLPKESVYWFNLAPLAVLLGYSLTNFPSKSKIISIFEKLP